MTKNRTIRLSLQQYVEQEILPRYDLFDAAHQREHVDAVIEQSMEMADYYEVDCNMVYAIAAYHDTGIAVDRETHHLHSGRIVRCDNCLRQWFSEEQIEVMAQAVEDHRASNSDEPRSIYGKIVADADRQIDGYTIVCRTVQYAMQHHPEADKLRIQELALRHLDEKYAEGGYLRFWLPQSANAERLRQFQQLIKDRDAIRRYIGQVYDALQ
ncbi:MAG: HD domain-containing protein [Bacteroidales bacterium]|nr:HD domain-containing protein [Candidatus Colimorpha onthohippi]